MPGADRLAGRRRVMSSVVSGASFFAAETSRERTRARTHAEEGSQHSRRTELNWTKLRDRHDAIIGQARRRHHVIGWAELGRLVLDKFWTRVFLYNTTSFAI